MFESLALDIVAALIAAVIIGGFGFFAGQLSGEQRYRKKYESGITSFSKSLEKAIFSENEYPSKSVIGPFSPIVTARVIVSIRDSTRLQLSDLSKLLNSDIDRLGDILSRDHGYDPDIEKEIVETLYVLRGTWPAKKAQIDVAVRKLLAELGMNEA